jgi:hypothetical protein
MLVARLSDSWYVTIVVVTILVSCVLNLPFRMVLSHLRRRPYESVRFGDNTDEKVAKVMMESRCASYIAYHIDTARDQILAYHVLVWIEGLVIVLHLANACHVDLYVLNRSNVGRDDVDNDEDVDNALYFSNLLL